MLEPLPDERLEGVELARARRRCAWPEGGFVEPEAYGLRVQGELSGDLGEVELVDAVQVMDASVGGVVDHVRALGSRNRSASRIGASPRWGEGRCTVAGRSSDNT